MTSIAPRSLPTIALDSIARIAGRLHCAQRYYSQSSNRTSPAPKTPYPFSPGTGVPYDKHDSSPLHSAVHCMKSEFIDRSGDRSSATISVL
jgi:hypothetical protein